MTVQWKTTSFVFFPQNGNVKGGPTAPYAENREGKGVRLLKTTGHTRNYASWVMMSKQHTCLWDCALCLISSMTETHSPNDACGGATRNYCVSFTVLRGQYQKQHACLWDFVLYRCSWWSLTQKRLHRSYRGGRPCLYDQESKADFPTIYPYALLAETAHILSY